MSLSSATIRNVMADLEAYGFVEFAPHFGRGACPLPRATASSSTPCWKSSRSPRPRRDQLRTQLSGAEDSRGLVSVASQLLSNVTQMAGVVSLQAAQAASLTHIEFLPLSEQRVLGHPGVRRP